jgi:histidinol-phosphatase
MICYDSCMKDLPHFKKVALDAIQKAEERIMYYYRNLPPIDRKADMTPVTKADKEAEEIIIDTIKKAFPDHGFLGEEFGDQHKNAEFVWIIDPIDGTKNFIHQLDFFGTVLGLKHEGKIILGVSNMPAINELLFASEEEETTLNGKPVRVSTIDSLEEAYVNLGGFGNLKDESFLHAVTTIEKQTINMRGYGDVHGYHLVATGRTEVIFEPKTYPWDVSAYQIIIKQAGGKYSDFNGNEFALGPSSLATNGLVHDKMLEIFKQAKGEW